MHWKFFSFTRDSADRPIIVGTDSFFSHCSRVSFFGDKCVHFIGAPPALMIVAVILYKVIAPKISRCFHVFITSKRLTLNRVSLFDR